MSSFIIDFEPLGHRITGDSSLNLLEIAQQAGIPLQADCGGVGVCGKCKIRHIEGDLTPLTSIEKDVLTDEEICGHIRLACQSYPLSPIKIDIPTGTSLLKQRLQLDGHDSMPARPAAADLQPRIRRLSIDSSERWQTAGELKDMDLSLFPPPNLPAGRVCLAVRTDPPPTQWVGWYPDQTALPGLAVDIGSTKLAAYLVDLNTGATLGQNGCMNPQISFGEDIISRIAFANQSPENTAKLRRMLVDSIQQLAEQLCHQAGFSTHQITDAVMAGNTVMHHFLLGLPVQQLGESPYQAAEVLARNTPASEIGFRFAPGAWVYTPPNIAGFIGGDHTAALSILPDNGKAVSMLIDIGTNTEISLIQPGSITSCSTASGPAFEGAHIRDGMRASPGAIDEVSILGNQIKVHTIASAPPIGICGTGILSAISAFRQADILDTRGHFNRYAPRVTSFGRSLAYRLVTEDESAYGKEILITQKDVQEVQLAKAAIRTGLGILLENARINAERVDHWYLAGAFGTYLQPEDAIQIGMFPRLRTETIIQLGNASGIGSKKMLLSTTLQKKAESFVSRVQYTELMLFPDFSERFIHNLFLA